MTFLLTSVPPTPASGPENPALTIDVFASKRDAAQAAARTAAAELRECVRRKGQARIMVGTGNSQVDMIGFLAQQEGIDWSKIDAFHLDEYVGLAADHPSSFRYWIRHQFVDKVHPRSIAYIEGDSPDFRSMLLEYTDRLLTAPIDLAFVGIGENGHIAFNDPHVADFNDSAVVKRVVLDEQCRRQQVGEGHFPDLESVPKEAVTVTCSGLFRAARWICCVPDRRKAQAIKETLEGPVTPRCPGTLVNRHPSAALFLDTDSASLLTPGFLNVKCRVHTSSGAALSAS